MHQKAWRENVRNQIQKAAEQKRKKNVRARARQAVRNGKSYQTKFPELKAAAASAHAAEVKSRQAMRHAKSAHEQASSAHEAAGRACEAADEAKKDAAEARCLARTIALDTKMQLTSFAQQSREVKKSLGETAARAMRNEERLNTVDCEKGFVTPQRFSRQKKP